MRPHVLAGAALVGASVLAVTPIAPPSDIRIANPATRLTAASQLPGPIAAIANVPFHELAALQALADALQENGPLACFPSCPPNNFLGWEPGFDEAFMEAVVEALLPFPLIAQPIADNLNAILLAELPVNPEGCAGVPAPCPDPGALFRTWFTVPLSQLVATGRVDPLAPIQGLIATLTTPSTIQLPDIQGVLTTAVDLSAGLAVFLLPSPDFIASLFLPSTYIQTVSTAVKVISAVATVTLARLIPGDFSQPFFSPVSPTSIPSLSPSPAQTLTISADQNNEVPGVTEDAADELGDELADVPTRNSPDAEDGADDLAGVQAGGEAEIFADAGQGPDTPRTAVEEEPTTTTSTDVMSYGNKVKPGQVGGDDTASGDGLAGTVKSVTDRITSSISNVTGRFTGGDTETGDAGTDGSEIGDAAADRSTD
ncbi:MAG TPA: hypothetical protein VFH65_24955 [Mycobacterium sp.]|nr:hypothetical protein [Mycobacterium sp.]